jgi:hypothetical protein
MFTRGRILGTILFGGVIALAATTMGQRANASDLHQDLRDLGAAVAAQHETTGQWPTDLDFLAGTASQAAGRSQRDPWGHPYRLRAGRVVCTGADGRPGGDGGSADHNWDYSQGRCSCGAR